MYEFRLSSNSDGDGGYRDDHYNWQPPEFCEGTFPMELCESAGNIMSWEAPSVVVDCTCSNLQAKISSHPLYPKLLLNYIDCHKVGAPPHIVTMLDNIIQENDLHWRSSSSSTALNKLISDDSKLDDFMVTYCDVLAKFKLDLERSFNEATTFLNNVQTQLTNLCPTINISEAEAEVEEEDNTIGVEANNDQQKMCRGSEIKDKLMGKYSGYISSLKQDFCNKINKGKFPREARQILLNWWTTHYNWPYPTEGEKVCLAKSTGLDPKQINNWFINQRKRHWKPSQNMQFDVMETI
ncbi:unnamed protein product [Withania somnifera]